MTEQVIPEVKSRGLFGSARELRDDRLGFIMRLTRDYDDIVKFRMGPSIQVYFLNNPNLIQQVLVAQADKFSKSPRFKENTRRLIGNGILTSEGEVHRRQRKLVQPAFHYQRIAAYGQTMVDYTERMLQSWHDQQTLDMHAEMMALTRDIVAKTLFNADVSAEGDQIGKAISFSIENTAQRNLSLLNAPDWLPTPRNRKRNESIAIMNRMLTRIIQEHRATGTDQGDLLSMLLMATDEENGSQMTDQQARDEAMTLFIAGHETTANATAWTWYLLSQHPEVEAKLMAELQSVLAGRSPTMKDLTTLPYTEKVINESMRLYPPAWLVGIRLALEDVTIGGYDIPKGSYVMMSPYGMHHNPRYFEDPETFNPDRWTTEFEKALPRFAYFPFGGGPRVCIGNSFALMEARLILATIAQHWHAELLPDQVIEPEALVTLRPKYGIQMRLSVREAVPT